MNKSKPTVSVVLPVYCSNDLQYGFLRDTLASVAAQNYRDFEVVIVDDVSKLDINPLIESIENLPDVRIIRNRINMGHIISRNIGVKASCGKYIAFLDHDDIWLPDKLGRQLSALKSNHESDMTFCNVDIFGIAHSSDDTMNIDQSDIPEFTDFIWFAQRFNYTVTASAVMVKKSAMERIGYFDTKYSICDDFDAWLRILRSGSNAVHVPEKLVRYRLHESNTSLSSNRLKDHYFITCLITRYYFETSFFNKFRLTYKILRKWCGVGYLAVKKLLKG